MESMSSINYLIKKNDKLDNCTKTFGLVVYTNSNPNVIKVLRDQDYWNSLDSRSGNEWNVFSIKPEPGMYVSEDKSQGSLSSMVPIWKESFENKQFFDDLGIESTEHCPFLIVCTEIDKNVEFIKVKIDDTTIESTHNSLSNLFIKINSEIHKMRAIDKMNSRYTHDAIIFVIKKQKAIKILKSGVGYYKLLRRLLVF